MDRVPDAVLENILGFVGSAPDFLSCERTCKAFHRVLAKDEIWQTCEEFRIRRINHPVRIDRYRDKAFLVRAIRKCRSWQKITEPAILHVVSVRQWKDLVDSVLRLFLGNPDFGNMDADNLSFRLRGDTSEVLMTIVERCLVTQFQRALMMAKHRNPKCPWPSVTVADMQLQDVTRGFGVEHPKNGIDRVTPNSLFMTQEMMQMAQVGIKVVENTKADKIIRLLAYQAGVVKMDAAVFNIAWYSLLKLIFHLLLPGCHFFEDQQPAPPGAKRALDTSAGETPWTVPPYPKTVSAGGNLLTHCTIVPKFVIDAAKNLGILYQFYGNFTLWSCETDDIPCREFDEDDLDAICRAERALAMAQYEWLDDEDDDMDDNFVYDEGIILLDSDDLESDDSTSDSASDDSEVDDERNDEYDDVEM